MRMSPAHPKPSLNCECLLPTSLHKHRSGMNSIGGSTLYSRVIPCVCCMLLLLPAAMLWPGYAKLPYSSKKPLGYTKPLTCSANAYRKYYKARGKSWKRQGESPG